MTQTLTAPAQIFVYDVGQVLALLEPQLEIIETDYQGRRYNQEHLIDLFLTLAVDSFEIVTVREFDEASHPTALTNTLRQLGRAISQLWDLLWFPPDCSGCEVLLKRVRSTLWVVVFDPHRLQPFTRLY
jgi:hypothetical protein